MLQELKAYLPELLPLLAEPFIEEIYINEDGLVRYMDGRHGRQQTNIVLEGKRITLFIRAAAAAEARDVRDEDPTVSAATVIDGMRVRIQGFLPPITRAPVLILRLARRQRIRLDDYIQAGFMSPETAETLRRLVQDHVNIILAGGTGTGKTTLLNALLLELPPGERLVILEDTDEVQPPGGFDVLKLLTTTHVRLRDLVRHALRSTPDRIIVGEVRDEAAKDLLEAWTTGHPGGLGTVHGETVEKALRRLARLARDGTVGGTPQEEFVAEAVGAIVMIEGRGSSRRVQSPMRVVGYHDGRFVLEPYR